MNSIDAIKTSLNFTQDNLNWFLSDLSDADLLIRPVPGANHIAWQLGHLITAEATFFAQFIPNASYPALPTGFTDQHGKTTAAVDPPMGFLTKNEYLDLFKKTRAATLAAVDRLSEADLDKPMPEEVVKYAPTLGAMLLLTSSHVLMHSGQFTVVRRKLGKPVLF